MADADQRDVAQLAFAPDLSEVVVQRPDGIEVYMLPGGRLRDRYAAVGDRSGPRVVHLGDALVYSEVLPYNRWRLVRRRSPSWFPEVLAQQVDGGNVVVAPVAEGFVAGAGRSGILVGAAHGPVTVAQPRANLLAADSLSGRLAVSDWPPVKYELDRKELTVLDAALRPIARCWVADLPWNGRFGGPDHLFAYRFSEGTYRVSPGGEYAAFAAGDGIRLRDLRLYRVAELIAQPMALATRADLEFLRTVESTEHAGVIGLLRLCFTNRFE